MQELNSYHLLIFVLCKYCKNGVVKLKTSTLSKTVTKFLDNNPKIKAEFKPQVGKSKNISEIVKGDLDWMNFLGIVGLKGNEDPVVTIKFPKSDIQGILARLNVSKQEEILQLIEV